MEACNIFQLFETQDEERHNEKFLCREELLTLNSIGYVFIWILL